MADKNLKENSSTELNPTRVVRTTYDPIKRKKCSSKERELSDISQSVTEALLPPISPQSTIGTDWRQNLDDAYRVNSNQRTCGKLEYPIYKSPSLSKHLYPGLRSSLCKERNDLDLLNSSLMGNENVITEVKSPKVDVDCDITIVRPGETHDTVVKKDISCPANSSTEAASSKTEGKSKGKCRNKLDNDQRCVKQSGLKVSPTRVRGELNLRRGDVKQINKSPTKVKPENIVSPKTLQEKKHVQCVNVVRAKPVRGNEAQSVTNRNQRSPQRALMNQKPLSTKNSPQSNVSTGVSNRQSISKPNNSTTMRSSRSLTHSNSPEHHHAQQDAKTTSQISSISSSPKSIASSANSYGIGMLHKIGTESSNTQSPNSSPRRGTYGHKKLYGLAGTATTKKNEKANSPTKSIEPQKLKKYGMASPIKAPGRGEISLTNYVRQMEQKEGVAMSKPSPTFQGQGDFDLPANSFEFQFTKHGDVKTMDASSTLTSPESRSSTNEMKGHQHNQYDRNERVSTPRTMPSKVSDTSLMDVCDFLTSWTNDSIRPNTPTGFIDISEYESEKDWQYVMKGISTRSSSESNVPTTKKYEYRNTLQALSLRIHNQSLVYSSQSSDTTETLDGHYTPRQVVPVPPNTPPIYRELKQNAEEPEKQLKEHENMIRSNAQSSVYKSESTALTSIFNETVKVQPLADRFNNMPLHYDLVENVSSSTLSLQPQKEVITTDNWSKEIGQKKLMATSNYREEEECFQDEREKQIISPINNNTEGNVLRSTHNTQNKLKKNYEYEKVSKFDLNNSLTRTQIHAEPENDIYKQTTNISSEPVKNNKMNTFQHASGWATDRIKSTSPLQKYNQTRKVQSAFSKEGKKTCQASKSESIKSPAVYGNVAPAPRVKKFPAEVPVQDANVPTHCSTKFNSNDLKSRNKSHSTQESPRCFTIKVNKASEDTKRRNEKEKSKSMIKFNQTSLFPPPKSLMHKDSTTNLHYKYETDQKPITKIVRKITHDNSVKMSTKEHNSIEENEERIDESNTQEEIVIEDERMKNKLQYMFKIESEHKECSKLPMQINSTSRSDQSQYDVYEAHQIQAMNESSFMIKSTQADSISQINSPYVSPSKTGRNCTYTDDISFRSTDTEEQVKNSNPHSLIEVSNSARSRRRASTRSTSALDAPSGSGAKHPLRNEFSFDCAVEDNKSQIQSEVSTLINDSEDVITNVDYSSHIHNISDNSVELSQYFISDNEMSKGSEEMPCGSITVEVVPLSDKGPNTDISTLRADESTVKRKAPSTISAQTHIFSHVSSKNMTKKKDSKSNKKINLSLSHCPADKSNSRKNKSPVKVDARTQNEGSQSPRKLSVNRQIIPCHSENKIGRPSRHDSNRTHIHIDSSSEYKSDSESIKCSHFVKGFNKVVRKDLKSVGTQCSPTYRKENSLHQRTDTEIVGNAIISSGEHSPLPHLKMKCEDSESKTNCLEHLDKYDHIKGKLTLNKIETFNSLDGDITKLTTINKNLHDAEISPSALKAKLELLNTCSPVAQYSPRIISYLKDAETIYLGQGEQPSTLDNWYAHKSAMSNQSGKDLPQLEDYKIADSWFTNCCEENVEECHPCHCEGQFYVVHNSIVETAKSIAFTPDMPSQEKCPLQGNACDANKIGADGVIELVKPRTECKVDDSCDDLEPDNVSVTESLTDDRGCECGRALLDLILFILFNYRRSRHQT